MMQVGVCLLALILLAGFPTDAFAYIDPGTGSLAYQAMLAALLGAGVMFRQARERVVTLVQRLTRRNATPPADRP